MAQPCPCGCERRLGFTRRDPADGYRRAVVLHYRLAVVVPAAVRQLEMPREEADAARRLVGDAAEVKEEFLEQCHGTAPGPNNDLLALSRRLASMEMVAEHLENAVRS